jgi:hypothetical protein
MPKRDTEKLTTSNPESGGPPAPRSDLPATAGDDAPPIWQDSSIELVNGVEVTDLFDTIPGELDKLFNP